VTEKPQTPICGNERGGGVTSPQTAEIASDAPSSDVLEQSGTDCSITGCEKPSRARGWCSMHYWRWSKHGDPEWEPKTSPSTCLAGDCDKAPKSAGYCSTHYSRLRRTGSVDDRVPVSIQADNARFRSKIDERGPRLCWPWTGTVLNTGYGQFAAQGKKHLAHRYAYRLFIGSIPEGLTIDHVWARGCMRHNCVNPHHLEAVTQIENTRRALMTRRELRRSA
jgi:hypothetical protein